MKQSPDNQINAFSHWHLENKWLVFLLRSSFFCTIRPLASSDATACYWPAPGQTDGIPESIKDHGYTSVFTNSWLVRQRNRSWIKGWGKNPQKSELVHCWQCLFSGATEPWTHGLRETITCIHVSQRNGTPWVTCWQGSRPKHTQIGMRV